MVMTKEDLECQECEEKGECIDCFAERLEKGE